MSPAVHLQQVQNIKGMFANLKKEISKVIVGQDEVIDQIIVAIICDANALLESYPGLGKTLMVKTLAQIMDLKFARIQSTPDLMPSDITGTYILEEKRGGEKQFKFQQGPLFANVILADEINRATPKTQSALLEAMQEKQVTVGNSTFQLDLPFFVLATQNPIDQEGTYPLPEAQTDRFLLKIKVVYPHENEEIEIINRYAMQIKFPSVRKFLAKDSLLNLQKYCRQVPISEDLKKKVVKLVNLTRNNKDLIEYGASPRASLGLVLAAKAHALINGRTYVSMDDVKKMAYPVLRHRIILSFKAEREGRTPDDAVTQLLQKL
ncbi:MoxR family ATPase [Candidatus Woesearchaeota archaeon]|nr:MoxR family ATPase [Candidatus Woesearchaeota archaeon]